MDKKAIVPSRSILVDYCHTQFFSIRKVCQPDCLQHDALTQLPEAEYDQVRLAGIILSQDRMLVIHEVATEQ